MIAKAVFSCLGLILGLIFLFGLIRHLVKIWNNKRKRLLLIGWVISLAAIIYVPIKLVNEFAPKYQHNTTFTSNYDPSGIDSLQNAVSSHYRLISSFKRNIESISSHINYPTNTFKNEPLSLWLIEDFNTLIASDDSLENDYGHVLMAIHLNNLEEEVPLIQKHLDLVTNTSILYYNYAQGLTYYRHYSMWKVDTAEYHLLKSVEENSNRSDTYNVLSRLYYHSDQFEKLEPLLLDENTASLVPYWVKRGKYFTSIDFINYWDTIISADLAGVNLAGFSAAFIILCLWLYFLRKMDIYEPEKWHHLILTFLLSIVCMHLLYPAHDILWNVFDYYRPTRPVSDFAYITISVGMVEEFVKILPVLIMLKFSKAINEPFDYILYASVSALGFAFVENIGYFGDQQLGNIAIRGFQCCMVHMAFSATIGYGLMLGHYRKKYNKFGLFILFFLLASFFHGFYDFWLMDWWAIEYEWVAAITTIIMIHLWVTYANNTLNISNFYRPDVILQTNRFKYIAFTLFVIILMLSYTIVSFNYGWKYGNFNIVTDSLHLILVVSYFALSLGFMSVTRGYLKPLQVPFSFLFPSKRKDEDLSNIWIKLTPSSKFKINDQVLPNKSQLATTGQLKQRVVIENNLNGYLVQLSNQITLNEVVTDMILIVPEWDEKKLSHKNHILVQIYHINSLSHLDKPLLKFSDFKLVGRVFSTYLPSFDSTDLNTPSEGFIEPALNS
jgi:RsiW-degrading membrane proteinase PrsW (M82 family)